MVKMINHATGTVMWVAEERVDEYTAAGHKLAADPANATTEQPKKRTKKEVTKK